jgi:hypothetical protein
MKIRKCEKNGNKKTRKNEKKEKKEEINDN